MVQKQLHESIKKLKSIKKTSPDMKFYKLKVSFGSLVLKDVSISDIYQEEKS